jgi:hypothetical protein
MIRAHYDPKTTIVIGYFDDKIYRGKVPEPFVVLEDGVKDRFQNKQMCVIDGVYQDCIKPQDIYLAEKMASIISGIKRQAKKRIYAKYPDHTQRNVDFAALNSKLHITTRALAKVLNLTLDTSDSDDTKDKECMLSHSKMTTYIDAIRKKSNAIEKSLSDLSPEELEKLDIANDKLWTTTK